MFSYHLIINWIHRILQAFLYLRLCIVTLQNVDNAHAERWTIQQIQRIMLIKLDGEPALLADGKQKERASRFL